MFPNELEMFPNESEMFLKTALFSCLRIEFVGQKGLFIELLFRYRPFAENYKRFVEGDGDS